MKLRYYYFLFFLCWVGVTAFPQNPAKTSVDCDCAAYPPGTLAAVNGLEISTAEIDDKLKQPIEQIKQYITDARRQELYLQINSNLLNAEAKRKGKSVQDILHTEVLDKIGAPTEKELQAFYQQEQGRFSGEFSKVQNEVRRRWSQQRASELAGAFANRLRGAAKIKIVEDMLAFSFDGLTDSSTVATVNDEAIQLSSLDAKLTALLYRQREQYYELQRQELELKINDRLLEAEAKQRQLTTQKFLETEIAARLRSVSDEQLRQFYEENKARLTGTYEQLKSRLLAEWQKHAATEAERALAEDLRKRAKIEIFLHPPRVAPSLLTTDGQPTRGLPSAPITIMVFSDFACPSCAALHPILEKLMSEYEGKLRLIARDFPLDKHPAAFRAAEAAEAARAQGKYWEYATLLFANQTQIEEPSLRQYASNLGLDLKLFDAALASHQYASQVERDKREGILLGLSGTPSLFLNGEKINIKSYDELKVAIQKVINEIEPSARH